MLSLRTNGLFAFLLGVGLFSCSYRVEKEEGKPRPTAELLSRISYGEIYTRVLAPKCISCHGASGGVNLETYSSARLALEDIYQSTIVQRRMPLSPSPPLSDEEIEILAAWVEAGGPEFASGSPGNIPPVSPLVPTFSSIKEKIIDVKCLQCHSPGGNAARIPLITVQDFLNSPLDIVLPGNADESGLVLVLQPDARKKMPPPETGMAPVSDSDLEVIKDWINRGANAD